MLPHTVAGLVRAFCSCCAERQALAPHADLDDAHLVCPQSLRTYLDRGDGVYEQDGNTSSTAPVVREPEPVSVTAEPDMLSDRPTRTGPKTRIMLEKATFAGAQCSTELSQVFPQQVDGRIVHRQWVPDLARAQDLAGAAFTRDRLRQEVRDMSVHFPRWLLTVSAANRLWKCDQCQGLLVFADGLRCVACNAAPSRRSLPTALMLSWFGLLPPIGIDGLAKIKAKLIAKPPKQHVVGHAPAIGHFLLVPLVVSYSAGFPGTAPAACYLNEFFEVPGMPKNTASHEAHLFGAGQMCLFASGQWRAEMTVREIVQQRAYAHVIKLLNYANGKRDAFRIVS